MDEVWAEKVRAYKESLKGAKPDLDIALLFRIMNLMNESSEVKIAIDPVGKGGEWDSTAPTWAVGGVTRLEDGRVALTIRSDKHGIEVGTLYTKLKKEFKHQTGDRVPVLFVRNEKATQLTDAYSHSLTREQYAGMPFDLVLAVHESKDDE